MRVSPELPNKVARTPDAEASGEGAGGSKLPTKREPRESPAIQGGGLGSGRGSVRKKELAKASAPRKVNQEQESLGPPKGVARAPDAEASREGAGGSQLPTKPGARKSRIVQVLEQLGPARARKRSERGTCINTVETGIPPQE